MNNKTYNKILAIFAITVILGGFYEYFGNGLNVEADAPVSTDSSLSSSSTSGNTAVATSDQIAEDTAFLATLTSLTRIKIDTSIYNDPSFNALSDNTVVLDPVQTGRPNPFAPVAGNPAIINAAVSPVVTNPPTGVTKISAELNGATNDTSGVTSVYFEYGPTEGLGKATSPTKESLIGTFVTKISGLTSGTTYFYRADAKINGTIHTGDVVSFTTN